MKLQDITGQKFGRLTVLEYRGNRKWLCRCDCGKETIVQTSHLKDGHTKSCGCLHAETTGINDRIRCLTHGECVNYTHSVEYTAYIGAKMRCTNPNRTDWDYYGGRGIEFKFNSFPEFLAELGRRPSDEYSIDRMNPDGNYEPGNVRWATKSEQSRNQRPRRRHYLAA